MATISGNVTIQMPPNEWVVEAYDASTHLYANSSLVVSNTYSISGLTANTLYSLVCRPNVGKIWTPEKRIYDTNYLISSNTSIPYIYIANTSQNIDQQFSNNSLLMHFNGANNSTTFTDVIGHTANTSGSPIITTLESKFNGSSIYFNSSSYLSIANTNTEFSFGTDDFTVECFIRFPAYKASNQGIIGLGIGTGKWQLQSFNTGSNINISFHFDTSTWIQTTYIISLNTWYHVAVTRQAGTGRLFVQGNKEAEGTYLQNLNYNGPLFVGYNGSISMHGYMAEARITKGFARYTGNFSIPTFPFSDNDGNSYCGNTEPNWNTIVGGTTTDNNIIWTNVGRNIRGRHKLAMAT